MRVGRLFNRESGRAFITAIDHGLVTGVQPGAERIVEAVGHLTSHEPEGILLSPGTLRHTGHLFAFHGAPSTLLRTDYLLVGERVKGLGEHHRVLLNPREAASLGADAVVMFLALGVEDGVMLADNAQAISRAAYEVRQVGLALLVEVVLWGSRLAENRDPELLAWGCRMAAELGADVIKTEYTGDPDTFASVVKCCPVPVLTLGGPKSGSEGEVLEMTRGAIKAGARGVVYGRNIWQADNPARISASIREVVHGTCARR
jgi:DhnA family fructose-bisphosphate aldolase class Ia